MPVFIEHDKVALLIGWISFQVKKFKLAFFFNTLVLNIVAKTCTLLTKRGNLFTSFGSCNSQN
jgi:hypothetical protein